MTTRQYLPRLRELLAEQMTTPRPLTRSELYDLQSISTHSDDPEVLSVALDIALRNLEKPSVVTLEVLRDPDPESPRTAYENLGMMVCFHRRHELGDDKKYLEFPPDLPGWAGLEEYLTKKCGAVVILPLYLLDHSGLSISTTPFGDPWDSGQVGFIFTSSGCTWNTFLPADEAAKVHHLPLDASDPAHAELLVKAKQALEEEVKTYDQYLRGDVWGYQIKDNGEVVDSCWGFYGEEYAREEANEALRAHMGRS